MLFNYIISFVLRFAILLKKTYLVSNIFFSRFLFYVWGKGLPPVQSNTFLLKDD